MKKVLCVLLCMVCLTGVMGCGGYKDASSDIPANWPTYAVSGMTFSCEAGWEAADISGFEDAAVQPFQLLGTTDRVQWVNCLASPEWQTKTRNFLAISYQQFQGTVEDSVLEEMLAGLSDIKSAFVSVNMTTSVLSSPSIARYGKNTALTFACRFTLEDGTQMIVRVGLVPHGDRLYQFHYVDYQMQENSQFLAQVLTSLQWN